MQQLRRRTVCVALLASMLAVFHVACRSEAETDPLPPADLVELADGVLVSARFDPDANYIVVIEDRARVLLVHPQRGEIDAVIPAGYNTMVAARHHPYEVLISSETLHEDHPRGWTLYRYSLEDGGPRLVAEHPQPYRTATKITMNNVMLSGDERYFFYPARVGIREDIPGCGNPRNPRADGRTCDDWILVAIDLETGERTSTPLPARCGYPQIGTAAEDGAAVACNYQSEIKAEVVRGSDGAVNLTVEHGGSRAIQRTDGRLVTFGTFPSVILHREPLEDRTLATPHQTMRVTSIPGRDEALVAHRVQSTFISGLHGGVRIDLRTFRITQRLDFRELHPETDGEVRDAVLRSDGTIAVLRLDGRIEIIERDGEVRVLPVVLWDREVGGDEDDYWYPDGWLLVPS